MSKADRVEVLLNGEAAIVIEQQRFDGVGATLLVELVCRAVGFGQGFASRCGKSVGDNADIVTVRVNNVQFHAIVAGGVDVDNGIDIHGDYGIGNAVIGDVECRGVGIFLRATIDQKLAPVDG